MGKKKLSSEEVPSKLIEWLLSMGCPSENVPSEENVAGMCRGQYYMVWRSLMEKIEPKDAIKNKKLQVFCDDYQKCRLTLLNTFNAIDTNAPEEITLWKEQTQLRNKVQTAELQLGKEKEDLHLRLDKISSKLSHRSLLRKRLQDAQRRLWFLTQLADEQTEKKANLLETTSIAESLCGLDDGGDIETKIDKCLNLQSTEAASSVATMESDDEIMSSLVKSHGDVLMRALHERRKALLTDLSALHISADSKESATPRSILAHTASLHTSMALEAIKNKLLIKSTSERLMAAVEQLSNHLNGPACELLVTKCEVSSSAARVQKARASSRELIRGVTDPAVLPHKPLQTIDTDIVSKRDELKRLAAFAAAVEIKTVNVRDCLVALFNNLHGDGGTDDRFGGRCIPKDAVPTLRQFYRERPEKTTKLDLSMNFDDAGSFNDTENIQTPTFADELKLYLKKFSLEKNKKLVLDSGEKLWAFETFSSTIDRIHAKWQLDEVTTSLLCPSVSLRCNLRRLNEHVARKAALERRNSELSVKNEARHRRRIDITPITTEEQAVLEKIKKRLHDNIQNLKKTNRSLDVSEENLTFWSDNDIKKYISDKRTIEGITLREFEKEYISHLRMFN